jgi:hypothetical protein
MDDASHGSPGTDLVPLAGGRALPRELIDAADLALGAGAMVVGTTLRVGATARDAVSIGSRIAGSLPGASLAARAASRAVRPVVEEGARTRRRLSDRAVTEMQRALEALVPVVVELIDAEAIVRRVDVDAIVRRIDVDGLLARVDLDALIGRIDVDTIAERIDVNAIVQRVDVDAVVEQTELGTIVARSTSGFAAEALDAARTQTVSADTLVTRLVDRMLRRRGETPLGPAQLVRDEQQGEPEPTAPAPGERPGDDARP